mgnify:CR=1 FL=1
MKTKLIMVSTVTAVMLALCCTPPTVPLELVNGHLRLDVLCDGSWVGSNWSGNDVTFMSGTKTQVNAANWIKAETGYVNLNPYYGGTVKYTSGSFIQLNFVYVKIYKNNTSNSTIKLTVSTNVINNDLIGAVQTSNLELQ